jgi:hypothetical protein
VSNVVALAVVNLQPQFGQLHKNRMPHLGG